MDFGKIKQQIRDALKDRNVASLSLAVAKDGAIIWEDGFGWANRESRLRSDPHIAYSLASISKLPPGPNALSQSNVSKVSCR